MLLFNRIMTKLYQLDDLVARLPADRRCLKTALEASIQVITQGWREIRGRDNEQHLEENMSVLPWQVSVSKWYQNLYDISRLKSVVLQCYALKEASGSCLSLCETIQKTIRPAVKKLYDTSQKLYFVYNSSMMCYFFMVEELMWTIWLSTLFPWINW